MSEIDRNIVNAWRELRSFCRQVQLLLGAADGLMSQKKWTNPGPYPNMAWGDFSQLLARPDDWLPQCFCRFYVHKDYLTILGFVAVIFEEVTKPESVEEALISAGWFDYGDVVPQKDWSYWFCKTHLWAQDRKDDGQLCFGKLSDWDKDLPSTTKQIASLAYPLTTIASEQDLDRLVVSRLQAEIRETLKASSRG